MLDINFADSTNNAFELMILTSSEKADKVIEIFRKKYSGGITDPNLLLHQIYKAYNINEDDFMQSDIDRLNHELNRIVRYAF